MKIIHITDTEGQDIWQQLETTIEPCQNSAQRNQNKGVTTAKKIENLLYNQKDVIIAFGGDYLDKGPYNKRNLLALIDLKKRFEKQIFIMLGNRDLNKLRIPVELQLESIEKAYHGEQHELFQDPGQLTFFQWCQSHQSNFNKLTKNQKKIIYLEWMFNCTMGSKEAFQYYQEELAFEKPNENNKEDVLNFITTIYCGNKCLLQQFLELALIDTVKINTTQNNTSCPPDIYLCHGAPIPHGQQLLALLERKSKKGLSDNIKTTLEKYNYRLDNILQSLLKRYDMLGKSFIDDETYCLWSIIQNAACRELKELPLAHLKKFPQDKSLTHPSSETSAFRGLIQSEAIWDTSTKELKQKGLKDKAIYLTGHKPWCSQYKKKGREYCLINQTLILFGDSSFTEHNKITKPGGIVIEKNRKKFAISLWQGKKWVQHHMEYKLNTYISRTKEPYALLHRLITLHQKNKQPLRYIVTDITYDKSDKLPYQLTLERQGNETEGHHYQIKKVAITKQKYRACLKGFKLDTK